MITALGLTFRDSGPTHFGWTQMPAIIAMVGGFRKLF